MHLAEKPRMIGGIYAAIGDREVDAKRKSSVARLGPIMRGWALPKHASKKHGGGRYVSSRRNR